jgi:SAM-dependent methyltransferase
LRRPEFIARQSACPSGLLGRLIGQVMARETAAANAAALELLELEPVDHVLEVGFGHGATIARAAAAVSRGFAAGVDPSGEMCRMAARRNRAAVAAGRVELRQASADALPYAEGAFDKVLSVHTLYFWRELSDPLSEMRRILKTPGRLVLGWRDDPGTVGSFPASVYRFHDEEHVGEVLRDVGFHSVEITSRRQGAAVLRLAVASLAGSTMRP